MFFLSYIDLFRRNTRLVGPPSSIKIPLKFYKEISFQKIVRIYIYVLNLREASPVVCLCIEASNIVPSFVYSLWHRLCPLCCFYTADIYAYIQLEIHKDFCLFMNFHHNTIFERERHAVRVYLCIYQSSVAYGSRTSRIRTYIICKINTQHVGEFKRLVKIHIYLFISLNSGWVRICCYRLLCVLYWYCKTRESYALQIQHFVLRM